MILPQYQSVGLGTALQKKMIEYAKSKGFRGVTASILTENKKMLKLANSGFSEVSIKKPSFSEYEVTMLF
jgi:L-amino acid N-acyltransferase YncA